MTSPEISNSTAETPPIVSPEVESMVEVIAASCRYSGLDIGYHTDQQKSSYTQAEVNKTTGELNLKVVLSNHQLQHLTNQAKSAELPPDTSETNLVSALVMHELGHVSDVVADGQIQKLTPANKHFDYMMNEIGIDAKVANTSGVMNRAMSALREMSHLHSADTPISFEGWPKHQQFTEILLALASKNGARQADFEFSPEQLESFGLTNVDPAVVEALGSAFHYPAQDGQTYNLVQQMIAHEASAVKSDNQTLAQAQLNTRRGFAKQHIKPFYDQLLEKDRQEQQSSPGDQTGEGDQTGKESSKQNQNGQNGGEEFDYPEQNCSAEVIMSPEVDESGQDSSEPSQQPTEQQADSSEENNHQPTAQQSDHNNHHHTLIDLEDLQQQIQQAQEDYRQHQAEQFRQQAAEYGLSESDYNGYLNAANKHRSTIEVIAEQIYQLQQERLTTQLSPQKVGDQTGKHLNIMKAATALAIGRSTNDIFDRRQINQRIEYLFDGLDVWFVVDSSGSMKNSGKAQAAAEATVILGEALRLFQTENSLNLSPDEIDQLVRFSVIKFGASTQELFSLSPSPNKQDLGRTFKTLRNPKDGNTMVASAIKKAKQQIEQDQQSMPSLNRHRLIMIVSDGLFHDPNPAEAAAKQLNGSAQLVQIMIGGQSAPLTNKTIVADVNSAQELPSKLIELTADTINRLNSTKG